MGEFDDGSFDPKSVAVLETAFDEASLTLKLNANDIRRTDLARCILNLAMEGERDPARLRDEALLRLNRAIMWRRVS